MSALPGDRPRTCFICALFKTCFRFSISGSESFICPAHEETIAEIGKQIVVDYQESFHPENSACWLKMKLMIDCHRIEVKEV
jgi:hypothetical protein